jgi:hypothetical protein
MKDGFKKHLMYTVNVRYAERQHLYKKSIRKIHYKGKIYCVKVPNHVIYVRRNGKPMWTGNSFDMLCYLCTDWGEMEANVQDVFDAVLEQMGLKEKSQEERGDSSGYELTIPKEGIKFW